MKPSASPMSKRDLRKAAVLISTLDTRSADSLLEKMPPESADLVRQMIMEMDDIHPAEQDEVIREFFNQAGGRETVVAEEGVELSIGGGIHEPPQVFPVPVTVEPVPRPFAFLREVRTSALVRLLEHQHPQLVAVVTAHLPPTQAAEFVRLLAPRTQADVLRRVAELDLADQEVLADIERELERLLGDELRAQRSRQAGLATLSTILEAAGEAKRDLWDNLSRHHQDLAAQLPDRHGSFAGSAEAATAAKRMTAPRPERLTDSRPMVAPRRERPSSANQVPVPASRTAPSKHAPPGTEPGREGHGSEEPRDAGPRLSFEQLATFSDDDWATLVRESEPAVVLLALTGASESLLQRVTRRLSRRDAQALRKKIQQTGPLRLSDIEQAQRRLAQLAGRLIATGQITSRPKAPNDRRGFAAAA